MSIEVGELKMKSFTFNNYKKMLLSIKDNNYKVITLKEFFLDQYNKDEKILVNRIDVDIKIERLKAIHKILQELDIKATIFVRIHSPNYNLFSMGNIAIIQDLISLGCEIGLHTELEDMYGYCNIEQTKLLVQEIKFLETVFGIKIFGSASHGDMTHYNNLDFWKTHKPEEFNLLYEAYDEKLWKNCRYVSDGEWTQWKAYEGGILLENDRRAPEDHIRDSNPKALYLLTHPECWYNKYIYE